MTRAARTAGSARRSMAYLLAKLQYSAGLPMKNRLQSQSAVSGANCTCRLMTAHGYRARSVLFALTIMTGMAVGTAQPHAADPVTLEGLLNRAAWYLDYFIDRFENVVAEE